MMKHLFVFILATAMVPVYAQAQSDDTDLYDLSLEELMNVTIVSASRSEEKAFEAPLSSFAITSNEIVNSGSTSIPEALRLCPGLFVKQMSNGVYDVSIRGLDNLPSHDFLNSNKFILVMINNRPVFDYLNGGTFWQNLPVDIIDVERIEVILGPSAPLYGPNAVTGVINIITKGTEIDGISVVANVQGGTPESYIGQAWLGYSVNDKLDITGSVNYQSRGRTKEDYYDVGSQEFITDLNESTNALIVGDKKYIKLLYPNPEIALEKIAGNVGISYAPRSNAVFDFAAGFVDNTALYGFSVLGASNYLSNRSIYGMIKGQVNGFSFQGSVLNGRQGLLGDIEAYQYNFKNFDGYVDYNFQITENLSIRPALNIQSSTIDDEKFTVEKGAAGIFNNKATMYNYAGSIKADYTLGKLRFIGAVRGDKFKYPNDLYLSYQGLINYKLNDQNNFRLVVAESNSGSFISDTYLNNSVAIPPSDFMPFTTKINLLGNKDRNLVKNRLYEIGYRLKALSNLQFDLAIFQQKADGFSSRVRQAPQMDFVAGTVDINMQVANIDKEAVQNGVTLAVNWVSLKNTLNIKPFVTLQKTEWLNYSPYYITPEAAEADSKPNYSTQTQSDVESKATPKVYGGFYANYAPTGKWNINLNGYLMSEYEIFTANTSETQQAPYTEFPASYLDGKFILNAKLGYQITKSLNLFVSARNAFNEDGREYFGTDKIGAMYLGGLNFNL